MKIKLLDQSPFYRNPKGEKKVPNWFEWDSTKRSKPIGVSEEQDKAAAFLII